MKKFQISKSTKNISHCQISIPSVVLVFKIFKRFYDCIGSDGISSKNELQYLIFMNLNTLYFKLTIVGCVLFTLHLSNFQIPSTMPLFNFQLAIKFNLPHILNFQRCHKIKILQKYFSQNIISKNYVICIHHYYRNLTWFSYIY